MIVYTVHWYSLLQATATLEGRLLCRTLSRERERAVESLNEAQLRNTIASSYATGVGKLMNLVANGTMFQPFVWQTNLPSHENPWPRGRLEEMLPTSWGANEKLWVFPPFFLLFEYGSQWRNRATFWKWMERWFLQDYITLIFVESLRIVLKESFMEDPLRICRVTCHRTSELLASRQMSSQ